MTVALVVLQMIVVGLQVFVVVFQIFRRRVDLGGGWTGGFAVGAAAGYTALASLLDDLRSRGQQLNLHDVEVVVRNKQRTLLSSGPSER